MDFLAKVEELPVTARGRQSKACYSIGTPRQAAHRMAAPVSRRSVLNPATQWRRRAGGHFFAWVAYAGIARRNL
jgi:hypothetical protein